MTYSRTKLSISLCFVYLLVSFVSTTLVLSDDSGDGPPVFVRRAYLRFPERASIAFERAGTVKTLFAAEGHRVIFNEILVGLDDALATSALELTKEKYESTIAIQQAALAYDASRHEHEAVVNANREAPGTYTKTDVRRLKHAMEKAKLDLALAKEERQFALLRLRHAEAELATYTLKSPFSATVSKVYVSLGDSVQAGDKTMDIVDTSKLRVYATIPFDQALNLTSGDKMVVNLGDLNVPSLLGQTGLKGQLQFIDIEMDAVRGVVAIWGDVENPGFLKDGIEVELTIYPTHRNVDDNEHRGDSAKPESSSSISQTK